ncbi:MAG TPA: hypothetical protein VHF89_05185 [Solirubrobacteraceae bacterium]|nr:hypothetical protein [Solirubrobacteraceae bacterium]
MDRNGVRRAVLCAVATAALLIGASPALAEQFALDASFGTDGRAVTPAGWRPSFEVDTVRAQRDAALLLGGFSIVGDVRRPTIVRIRRSGLRDREFGERGETRLPLAGEEASVAGIVEQESGRLIALASAGPSSVSGEQLVVGLRHDGSLDPSFGSNGVVDVDDTGLLRAYAIARDAAGRVVVAGSTGKPALVRLTPDGAIDPSFGGGGLAPVADHAGGAAAVDVAPGDARPVALIAGYDHLPKAVVRVTADGTVDASFGDDGTTELWFEPGWRRIAVDVAGRAVVPTRHGVARLGPNGGRDAGFAQLTLAEYREPTTVAVQPDGAVLYGVTRYLYSQDGQLRRLHADGARDGTFGDMYPDMGRPSGVTALPGGGAAMAAHPADVVKVTRAGQLDPTFHGDGRRTVGAGDHTLAFATGMKSLPDGRLVSAGGAWFDDAFRVVLTRHRPGGARDGSFAGCGVSVAPSSWVRMRVDDLALDGDATVLAGEETDFAGESRFLVSRVLEDGRPDPAFGDGGQAAIPLPGIADGHATAVGADGAGRVLAAGVEHGGSWGRTAVTRLLPSGHVDPTWGAGGWMYGPGGVWPTDVRPLADGGAFVTGSDRTGAEPLVVLRLTPMGTLDPSFGARGVARADVPGWPAEAALTADGGIVVAVAPEPDGIVRLVKLTAAGTLDPAFGADGIATLHRENSRFDGAGIRTDSLGRLLVTSTLIGYGWDREETDRVAVARVHPVTGQPDATFGPEGWLIGPAPDDATTPFQTIGVAEQPSGRIVVAGRVGGPSYEFGLLGFTEGGDPAPPPAGEEPGAPAGDCGFGPPPEPLGSAADDPPLPADEEPAPPPAPHGGRPDSGDGGAGPIGPAVAPPAGPATFAARAPSPQSLAVAMRRGIAVHVGCDASCRIVLTVRAAGRRVRRLLRVAAGRRVARVRLPRSMRQRLRRLRRPKLVADVRITAGEHPPARQRLTIVLRRP